MERARLVVWILYHYDVGGIGLKPLALTETPVKVGCRFRLNSKDTAGLAENRLHTA